jgi:uncharacterized protein
MINGNAFSVSVLSSSECIKIISPLRTFLIEDRYTPLPKVKSSVSAPQISLFKKRQKQDTALSLHQLLYQFVEENDRITFKCRVILYCKRRFILINILILGASGRVGCQIVTLALRDRHFVTALVRTPEKIQINNGNLTILQGNVLNKDDIVRAMREIDVVISALNTDGTTTLSDSMPLIIEAMENQGIKRIITIGTAGILQSRTSPNTLRYQSSESKRKSVRAAKEHHKVYDILKQSTLEWTIVCPTYLPDGKSVGNYRVDRNFLPEAGVEISVPDTAEFTYNLIKSNDYIHSRVGIAY